MKLQKIHPCSCHCGAVQYEVDLPNGLDDARRCNCSICSKHGAIVFSVPLDDLRVTKGADKLSLYQFNTKVAKHYFCSICGIYTHHQRRSNPHQFGVNLACLEGVDCYELGEVAVGDGRNHSCDR
ncbi:MAG: GFA family protein [Oceanospirillaceae bacterium]|jgi:hypothetical protein|nr:GFA family protein [Oceanospirillaceae bacterium]MBT4442759.1 GFA family protein [Oceanospirillaceae bacterium]MBT6078668.1 GFA family protein [Oceanospirillaceae bacterium]MBT7330750.1 GFA family protein [Oceanospirillaceae bacterium]